MTRYDIHAVPHGKQWALIREGDDAPLSLHDHQADAEREGRQLAEDGDVQFIVHVRDGAQDSYEDDPRESGE